MESITEGSEEYFEPCTYEEFVTWRLGSWEFEDDFHCIIRVQHVTNGKVKEHVYKQQKAADKCLLKYLEGQEHDITVCNNNAIHHIHQSDLTDFFLS